VARSDQQKKLKYSHSPKYELALFCYSSVDLDLGVSVLLKPTKQSLSVCPSYFPAQPIFNVSLKNGVLVKAKLEYL
jgi:hypothetical protein